MGDEAIALARDANRTVQSLLRAGVIEPKLWAGQSARGVGRAYRAQSSEPRPYKRCRKLNLPSLLREREEGGRIIASAVLCHTLSLDELPLNIPPWFYRRCRSASPDLWLVIGLFLNVYGGHAHPRLTNCATGPILGDADFRDALTQFLDDPLSRENRRGDAVDSKAVFEGDLVDPGVPCGCASQRRFQRADAEPNAQRARHTGESGQSQQVRQVWHLRSSHPER